MYKYCECPAVSFLIQTLHFEFYSSDKAVLIDRKWKIVLFGRLLALDQSEVPDGVDDGNFQGLVGVAHSWGKFRLK